MTEPLHAAPLPCVSCPYRKDVPSGVWSEDEYAKLTDYDPIWMTWPNGKSHLMPSSLIAVFHCHQENSTGIPTVCRGWLSVHDDCIAVRLALADGRLTEEQVDAPVAVELFATGEEAAEHGMADYYDPGPEARDMQTKLLRRGVGKLDGWSEE